MRPVDDSFGKNPVKWPTLESYKRTPSSLEQLEQLTDEQSELSHHWEREHNEYVIRKLTG